MRRCAQELCRNWGGDGCVCSVLDLEPDVVAPDEHYDHDVHGVVIVSGPDGFDIDEDCDCPRDCPDCETEGVLRP